MRSLEILKYYLKTKLDAIIKFTYPIITTIVCRNGSRDILIIHLKFKTR